MRIYLDMCCYNRPYDDQAQTRIALESQAKLHIQSMIRECCTYFISTDIRLLKYKTDRIKLVTPVEFIMETEGEQ